MTNLTSGAIIQVQKEKEDSMFERLRFRRTFGFAPPKWYTGASEGERRVVELCLSDLEAAVGARESAVKQIEEDLHWFLRPPEILRAARRCRRALKAQEAADFRLLEACRLAVRYWFQPVPRFSWLVKHEQERREKAAR